ncbi:hypothetical protein ABT025_14440 [Streptomyces sp. NPDC002809]|uniref:hypothetical protein n=1 Tax=Streptomyces sp. NPDC002809 TaxID=3154433 RepID=UPI0033176AD2
MAAQYVWSSPAEQLRPAAASRAAMIRISSSLVEAALSGTVKAPVGPSTGRRPMVTSIGSLDQGTGA